MREPILASILIPCYNQAHVLAEAIDSALAQTYPRVEVVVVDDGSTDGTAAVAERYGDRIVLVRQPNAGLSEARNTAIRHASGGVLVLLDSDDVLLPHSVASRVALLEADPAVGIVAGYYREIDEQGVMLDRVPEVRHVSSLNPFYQTVKRNWGPPVGWTFRREAVEECGGFDPTLRSCEDWDLLMRVTARWKLAYDPSVGALYRQSPGSMSRNHRVMLDAAAQVLAKNARLAPNRLAYAWWAQFGRFQHGRRVLFNVLTTGPWPHRLRQLFGLVAARPHLLWVGAFSLVS
ncbi:MAG: glycosyltransferase, partial [Fimbriimonadaceae bacterium]|nr:glycosyltransferase [Fimbriimonadaceae bacterium]